MSYFALKAVELARQENSNRRGSVLSIISKPLLKARKSIQLQKMTNLVKKTSRTVKPSEQWEEALTPSTQILEKTSGEKDIDLPTSSLPEENSSPVQFADRSKRDAAFYKRFSLLICLKKRLFRVGLDLDKFCGVALPVTFIGFCFIYFHYYIVSGKLGNDRVITYNENQVSLAEKLNLA